MAFEYCGEGIVRHLDDEVYVVRHRAEGMAPMTEALGPFLEQKVEPVPVGMKTCPDFRRHAEKSAKPQRGIGGDCAFSVYNLASAARRDVDFPCKLVDAEIERFYEIFEERQ